MSMDMNRYLIVVFCVLTGCAAAVPMANAQDFSVDNELFAEWYADHIHQIEEVFAAPILVSVEQEQLSGEIPLIAQKFSLLKKLPKFPASNQQAIFVNYPELEHLGDESFYSEPYITTIVKHDNPIRAPGLSS